MAERGKEREENMNGHTNHLAVLAIGAMAVSTSSALENAAYPEAHVDMADKAAVKAFYRDTMERLADFALVPPKYIQHPGDGYGGKYCVTNLDYCMCGTVTVTKKGRIWAGWFSGGDDPRGFFCAARSDDGGRTWSDPVLVVDPHDNSLPVPRFMLCADLWVDPQGRMHIFHDQTMGGYFVGSAPRPTAAEVSGTRSATTRTQKRSSGPSQSA